MAQVKISHPLQGHMSVCWNLGNDQAISSQRIFKYRTFVVARSNCVQTWKHVVLSLLSSPCWLPHFQIVVCRKVTSTTFRSSAILDFERMSCLLSLRTCFRSFVNHRCIRTGVLGVVDYFLCRHCTIRLFLLQFPKYSIRWGARDCISVSLSAIWRLLQRLVT